MTEPEIISLIDNSYRTLRNQADYSPHNQTVNNVLGKLVLSLIDKNTLPEKFCNKILTDKRIAPCISPIRSLCQKAECEMEIFWAKHFANLQKSDFERLKEFWYYQQYYQITLNENSFIDKHAKSAQNIAFIGSGPLPMTAIILKSLRKCNLDLIDRDAEAIKLSQNMCQNLYTNLNFVCGDAMEIDYKKFDVVFVASMVTDKIKLIEKLYQDGVKYLIIRDAEKFSQLFYEKLDTEIFRQYRIKDFIAGDKLTINSSYLLERA